MTFKGYKVEMLDEVVPEGNGYGIKPETNPDYLIEGKVFDCYSPDEGSVKNIIGEINKKTKKQAVNLILNLEAYEGNVEELIQVILRVANPYGDLKHLEELYIIRGGELIDIFE